MIYTEMTRKAMTIAYNAHHGKPDKGGFPYIFHPIHLAEQMDTEETVCIALLHDVVEDTEMTFEDLKNGGFTDEIIDSLRLLTHDKSEDYLIYIQRLKDSGNLNAIKVKLADLNHNSDLSRMIEKSKLDLNKIAEYKEAIKILDSSLMNR